MSTVAIVQPYVPEYRVALFERLSAVLGGAGHDLTVFAARPSGPQRERHDAAPLASFQSPIREYSVAIGQRRIRWKPIGKSIRSADLIVTELGSLVLENYGLAARGSVRYAGWGHGFASTSKPNPIDKVLERWLIRRSIHYFAYTERGKAAAVAQGLDPPRVTVLNNTLDTSRISEWALRLSDSDIDELRAQYGLRPSSTLLAYIGGLDDSKRLPFVFSSFAKIKRKIPDTQLIVAGDGRLRSDVICAATTDPSLRYIGRAGAREKAFISRIASLILNPGRVGLIAVDSFAMGCPIATTRWPFHAPEVDYLRSGYNALITVDDEDAYAAAVVRLLGDGRRLAQLRRNCLECAEHYSIDAMAERFASGISIALAT